CDIDCSGLLISDMQRLHQIITSINLTTSLPLPYKHMFSPQNSLERHLQLAGCNLGSLVTTYCEMLTYEPLINNAVTKVSADGEQTGNDAERIHKRDKDLELFVKNNLLAAEGTEHFQIHLNSVFHNS
uniref:Uncharacterized protein n=1 Tax=Salmo trutta TaxID=8032 RepID=A0A674B6F6_SALTR